MGRPAKRARRGPSPFEDEEDDAEADELSSDPATIAAKQDPGFKLDKSRAKAAFRLKSTFEDIFDKYSKDFSGVGDEIDLRTGTVVVDNGHLESLKDRDFGGPPSSRASSEAGSLGEEERILHGGTAVGDRQALSTRERYSALSARPAPFVERPSRLSQLSFLPALGLFNPYASFRPFSHPKTVLDPAWRVPSFPGSNPDGGFDRSYEPRVSDWADTRQVQGPKLRKLLTTGSLEDQDEDEILLGNSQTSCFRHTTKPGPASAPVLADTPPQALRSANIWGESSRRQEAHQDAQKKAARKVSPQATITGRKGGRPRKRLSESERKEGNKAALAMGDSSTQLSDPPFQPVDDGSISQISTVVTWECKPQNQTLIVAIRARCTTPQKSTAGQQKLDQGAEEVDVTLGSSILGTMSEINCEPSPGPTIRKPSKPRKDAWKVPFPRSLSKRRRNRTPPRTVIPDSQDPSPTLTASPVMRFEPWQPTFARNMVDPAYAFSDEEEPTAVPGQMANLAGSQAGLISSKSEEPEEALQDPTGQADQTEGPKESVAVQSEENEAAGTPTNTRRKSRRRCQRKTAPTDHEKVASDIKTLASGLRKAAPSSGQQTPPETPKDRLKKQTSDPPTFGTNCSARTMITSLVSDDEEDELSFLLIRTSPSMHRSAVRGKTDRPAPASFAKALTRKKLLASVNSKTVTPRPRRRSNDATRASFTGKRLADRKKAVRARHSDGGAVLAAGGASPPASLIRTPGGTMRQCGVGGFKCDRDFCFTCL